MESAKMEISDNLMFLVFEFEASVSLFMKAV